MNYNFRDSTTDIDSIIRASSSMKDIMIIKKSDPMTAHRIEIMGKYHRKRGPSG